MPVARSSSRIGGRVNLPLPDPGTNLSDYQDTKVLNTLDGFNLQPRLSVPFDGPIDVQTVNSRTVFLVSLGDTLKPAEHEGEVVGINQIVWDVASTTLHAESDEFLAQHTRYALIVTNGIHDTHNNPVEATEDFRDFRETVYGGYNHDLLDAIHAARRLGVWEQDIVTASVFTTQSATAVLEKIRDQIHTATPAPANFLLGSGGTRTVFPLDQVKGITWSQQVGADPPTFNTVPLPLGALQIVPGAVGEIAFGKYLSPDYEVHPGEYIPPVATRTGTPVVQGMNEIYFNLFLPSGPRPEGGWPVAIYGHGFTSNKNNNAQQAPFSVVATMAAHGMATVAINVAGNGFGPLGTLTVDQTMGDAVTFPDGGRGLDQDGDHVIGVTEGQYAAAPRVIIENRDAMRQTVADLMQLVRVIQVGMDVHGDGSRDLDPSRIYYFGQSLGGTYGTDFLAVEPNVSAGVLNVPSGPFFETLRFDRYPAVVQQLAARVPSLINSPGITQIGGVPSHPDRHLPACHQAGGQISAAVLRRIVAAKCGTMSNSKKNREGAKRRLKQQQQPRRARSGSIDANFIKPDIHREIRYITQLAQAEDWRIVTVGNLVLFSTRTRDAWLLDPEDDLAICLCREGEPQPFRIIDAPDTFAIEWTASFAIEGAAFIVQERSGKVIVIHGYPTVEIAATCRG